MAKIRNLRTILRDNKFHEIHAELREQAGPLYPAVAKGFIYDVISRRTGWSSKVVQRVLSSTVWTDPTPYYDKLGEL